FLVGLDALTQGDRARAEGQLPSLRAAPRRPPAASPVAPAAASPLSPLDLSLAGALESALLAASVDEQPASALLDPIEATQAVRALSEALDVGVRRPELRAARALCLLASTRGADGVAMGL